MDDNRRATVRRTLTVLGQLAAAGGLGVDARIHLRLASAYDAVRTSTLSQGDLFRAESVAAILAAVLILVRPRVWTGSLAGLVAAGGLGALLLYRFVDVGRIGPLPSMYEPAWYPDKTNSAIGMAVALVAALLVIALRRGVPGRSARTTTDPAASPSA
jgi:hypothetical protein